NDTVSIIGVGYFDPMHGQTGVAPDGLELHAVRGICWGTNCTVPYSGGGGGGDTTAPTTSITAPTSGATVSGTAVTVSASASDNVGVSKVEFYVDGSLIATDTTSPYSISWNSTGVTNGSHTLTSRAYDAAGNTGTSTGLSVTVNNSGGSCGTNSQLLGNPGFESGATVWTSTSGVITNSTSEAAHSGSYKAWLCGYGTTTTDYIYQTITIPSAACSATLSYWLHIDTAETTTTTAYDTVTVTIRNTSGTVLSTLATYSNLDANTGYVQQTFDLSAYKGQTIEVEFNGSEDSTLQTSFVVDDTAVNVTQ
ncbi:MAG: Ig-like domain-containing protein, partial [Archangium sp.]